MKKDTKSVRVNVRLSKETAKKLLDESKKDNVKLSDVIRKKLD